MSVNLSLWSFFVFHDDNNQEIQVHLSSPGPLGPPPGLRCLREVRRDLGCGSGWSPCVSWVAETEGGPLPTTTVPKPIVDSDLRVPPSRLSRGHYPRYDTGNISTPLTPGPSLSGTTVSFVSFVLILVPTRPGDQRKTLRSGRKVPREPSTEVLTNHR